MALPFGTGEPVDLSIGSTTWRGERWRFGAESPAAEDASAAADAYRARTAGSTWTCRFFGGVEYARADRWKPPAAHDPGGIVDATTFRVVPWQDYVLEEDEGGSTGRQPTGLGDGAYEWRGYGAIESEDCLVCHIWTPDAEPPAEGWPCIVYFHGGGNAVNSAASYATWGHWLAARRAVVISVEYRLGLFGYYWHEDYEAEQDWAGPHFAHQDRVFALQWINDNADALGVDTGAVCLVGTSAGGQAILLLLQDPAADGLYTAAWVASGGGASHYVQERQSWQNDGFEALAERIRVHFDACKGFIRCLDGRMLADAVSDDGWAAALRLIPPDEINLKLGEGYSNANFFPWLRAADFPHRNAVTAARAGALADVPLVISVCGNEASLQGVSRVDQPFSYNADGGAEVVSQNWAAIRGIAPWSNWSDEEQKRMLYQLAIWAAPARAVAQAHAAQGNDAWALWWNYKSPGNGGDYAGHSSDMAYLFGNVQWQTGLASDGETARIHEQDVRCAELMAQSLLGLAVNGDPALPWAGATNLRQWLPPLTTWAWQAYEVPRRNWNVIGTTARAANGALPVLTIEDTWYEGTLDDFAAGVK